MIDIILGNEIPDPKRQDERHDQAADRNGAETRFRGEVIVEIKIDADKSAVTALAVIDWRVTGENGAVVIVPS